MTNLDHNQAPITYVVRFLDLEERTREEFIYGDLFSAIQVAKETQIDNRPVISDEDFPNHLLMLLTSTFVYVGKKTDKYQEGSIMLQLFKRTAYPSSDQDEAIYGASIIPFVAGFVKPTPVAEIPHQRDMSSLIGDIKFFSDPERSTD